MLGVVGGEVEIGEGQGEVGEGQGDVSTSPPTPQPPFSAFHRRGTSYTSCDLSHAREMLVQGSSLSQVVKETKVGKRERES